MSSFIIIQLLIISVVGLMVQSAPVSVTDDHLQKRSTNENNQQVPENRLFCAALSLHIKMRDFSSDLTVPAAPQINDNIKSVMSTTFDHISSLCKNFTIAMSLTYQVQDLLFNTDTTPELSSDDIHKLSEILFLLQTMATAFDDIQYNRDHSRCVRLTAAQYRIMYYIQHPNTSLKQALKDIKEVWNSTDGDYKHEDLHC